MQDKWIEITDALTGIDQIEPVAFLLRKITSTGRLDSFRLKPLGDSTRLHAKLRRTIKDRLESMGSERQSIKDFDKDYDGDGVTLMDVESNSFVDSAIKTIFEMSDSNPIGSLKSMKTAKYSAVLFSMPNKGSIIAIDTVVVYHDAFSKVGHLLSYDNDVADVDGMILFKFDLPCIYFEKLGKLLVLDRKATERMFNLIEHYQEKIAEYFEGLADKGRIDMDPDDLEEWTRTITMARRVNGMIQNGLLDQKIDMYKRYEEYLDAHPKIDDDGLRLRVEKNKIVIPDKKHFESFLNFAEKNLQQSVIDPDDIYVVSRKRRVVTKP